MVSVELFLWIVGAENRSLPLLRSRSRLFKDEPICLLWFWLVPRVTDDFRRDCCYTNLGISAAALFGFMELEALSDVCLDVSWLFRWLFWLTPPRLDRPCLCFKVLTPAGITASMWNEA